MTTDDPNTNAARGLAGAFLAFTIWGLLPIYWKLLAHVPASEVLANRVLWTTIITLLTLTAAGLIGEVGKILADPRRRAAAAIASLLISTNQLTFIWAVANNRVTEISLGYYINPLLNALLGFVVLRERPSPLQTFAIGLATAGVLFLAVQAGAFPWLSLVLATCFACYGLVRKTAPVEPLTGLGAEALLASPLALAYLLFIPAAPLGELASGGAGTAILFVLSGVATALPLYLFAYGARRIPYTTVGVLMFTAPTLQLILAVLVYDEPFTSTQAITFGFIWLAVALYLVGMFRRDGP